MTRYSFMSTGDVIEDSEGMWVKYSEVSPECALISKYTIKEVSEGEARRCIGCVGRDNEELHDLLRHLCDGRNVVLVEK